MDIFRGVMPFLFMVFLAMVLVYDFPGLVDVAAALPLQQLSRVAAARVSRWSKP